MTSNKRRKGRQLKKHAQDDFADLKSKACRVIANDTVFIHTPNNEAKMSDMLAELVAPYLSSASTPDRYRGLLRLGIVAWNTALLPNSEQQNMVDFFIRTSTVPAPERRIEDMKVLVSKLIARKNSLFSEYKRAILSFDLKDTDNGYQLFVASSEEEIR